jgi:branched-chain amino acid transport system ATP-binding protein
MTSTPVLDVDGVTKEFGALTVTNDVTLGLETGARHALIGPNGAGKTTLFNLVAGLTRPSKGQIRFCGRDVTKMSEAARCRRGIGRTFQHSSLFSSASCIENVMLALRRRHGIGTSWIMPSRLSAGLTGEAESLIDRVGLGDRSHDAVDGLSHGERRQLEVAMALALEPVLLLLDEPTAGMSPAESARFTSLIDDLPDDLAVLVIEHDLDVVFSIANRVTVLSAGSILLTGSPQEVRSSSEVEEIYLGSDLDEVFITDG